MKYKIKRAVLFDGRGITLIEVIVSTALLAILSLMLVMAMSTALTAVRTTNKRTSKAMNAASQIELQRAQNSITDSTPSALTVTFGTAYTVSGHYVTDKGGTYTEFVPD